MLRPLPSARIAYAAAAACKPSARCNKSRDLVDLLEKLRVCRVSSAQRYSV